MQGRVQGRVYAMTQEQADADASVVIGIILISGIPAIALIDSRFILGESSSFFGE